MECSPTEIMRTRHAMFAQTSLPRRGRTKYAFSLLQIIKVAVDLIHPAAELGKAHGFGNVSVIIKFF